MSVLPVTNERATVNEGVAVTNYWSVPGSSHRKRSSNVQAIIDTILNQEQVFKHVFSDIRVENLFSDIRVENLCPENDLLRLLQKLFSGQKQLWNQLNRNGDSLKMQLDQLLEDNQIIMYLSRWKGLKFNEGQLTRLSGKVLKMMPNLTKLDVSNNHLEFLPKSIGELNKLIKLDVSNNHLESLPKSIGELNKLFILDVSHNQIESLPETARELTNMKILRISENRLKSVPPEIQSFKKIESLSLDHNDITFIPPWIGNLPNLKNLFLSHNNITLISSEVCCLANLENLFLSFNCITTLPDKWGSKLKVVHLRDNQISVVPAPRTSPEGLEELNIANNPIEIFGMKAKWIIISQDQEELIPQIGSLQKISRTEIPKFCVIGQQK